MVRIWYIFCNTYKVDVRTPNEKIGEYDRVVNTNEIFSELNDYEPRGSLKTYTRHPPEVRGHRYPIPFLVRKEKDDTTTSNGSNTCLEHSAIGIGTQAGKTPVH